MSDSAKCAIEDCQSFIKNPQHYFKLLNQNIRSISSNMSGLEILIARSNIDWDIMVLTECWLKTKPTIPTLNNYKVFASQKNFTQNEGVVIYVKKSLFL